MGLLARFWRWLTSPRPGPQRVYSDPRETKLEVDQVLRDLDVVRHARELGEKCLPPSGSQTLAGIESQLVLEVRNARAGYAAWARNRVSALNEQINACDVAAITNRALQVADEFSRNASALVSSWRNQITQLGNHFAAVDEEYKLFRGRHRITRPADYPSRARGFFLKAVLVGIIVGEGLINAGFFAKGLWGGYLQGFLVAMSLSLLNVALAYAWGRYLARYVNYVSVPVKIAAALSLVVYSASLVAIALWIGHYRDVLGNGAGDASALAWESFKAAPLALKDLASMILSGLTVVFGLGALLDAYHLDDAYPGYGAMHRQWFKAKEEFEERKDGLRDELQRLRQEAEDQVERLQESALVSLKGLDSANQQKETTEVVYSQSLADTTAAAHALIAKFRDENLKARPDHCRDVTFAPIPPLDSTAIDFNVGYGRERYAGQQQQIARLTNELELIRAKIQSSFNQQVDSQIPLDSLVATDGAK